MAVSTLLCFLQPPNFEPSYGLDPTHQLCRWTLSSTRCFSMGPRTVLVRGKRLFSWGRTLFITVIIASRFIHSLHFRPNLMGTISRTPELEGGSLLSRPPQKVCLCTEWWEWFQPHLSCSWPSLWSWTHIRNSGWSCPRSNTLPVSCLTICPDKQVPP